MRAKERTLPVRAMPLLFCEFRTIQERDFANLQKKPGRYPGTSIG
jgi:hypothetical protein